MSSCRLGPVAFLSLHNKARGEAAIINPLAKLLCCLLARILQGSYEKAFRLRHLMGGRATRGWGDLLAAKEKSELLADTSPPAQAFAWGRPKPLALTLSENRHANKFWLANVKLSVAFHQA